jgi:hypothetical protein
VESVLAEGLCPKAPKASASINAKRTPIPERIVASNVPSKKFPNFHSKRFCCNRPSAINLLCDFFWVIANLLRIKPTRLQQEAPRFSDHVRSHGVRNHAPVLRVLGWRSPDHRIARLLTERGRLSGSYRLFNSAKPVAALMKFPQQPFLL